MPPKAAASKKQNEVRKKAVVRPARPPLRNTRSTVSSSTTSNTIDSSVCADEYPGVHFTDIACTSGVDIFTSIHSFRISNTRIGYRCYSEEISPTPTVIRSIRNTQEIQDDQILDNNPIQEKKLKRKRNVVTGKGITKDIVVRGRRRFTIVWDEVTGLPKFEKEDGYGTCALFIGVVVRSFIPMTKWSYTKHGQSERDIIINQLSVNYEFDLENKKIYEWIQKRARSIYRTWNGKCKKEYEKGGKDPTPSEFVHRPSEWEWLCTHFESPEFKAASERGKKSRASANKLKHSSGPIPIYIKGLKLKKQGCETPHSEAYAQAYESFAPQKALEVRTLAKEAHLKLVNELRDANFDEMDIAYASKIQLPLEKEIEVIETLHGGRSVGTCVPGFGDVAIRPAQKRGHAKGAHTSSISVQKEEMLRLFRETEEKALERERVRDEELRLQKERYAQLEERSLEQSRLVQQLSKQLKDGIRQLAKLNQ